ncbi:MAG: cation diffusion facilitator family transporter [Gaiellales bacterium]
MAADHAHAHPHHHHHGVSADSDRRRLLVALTLIVAYMAVEVVVGLIVDSLALLADAAHMLTDAGALALSLVALRLAARPAEGNLTFGLKRAEILSAQANGATLLVLGVLIAYEGIHRLLDPPAPLGLPILAVALAGIPVNLAATWQLARANRESLNIEGSFQHLLTDLFAFVATAIAGGVILATGFDRADAIASLLIATTMIVAAVRLLRDSGRILLEIAPAGMDVTEIGRALAAHQGVVEVHDLHLWEISSGFPALSAHVLVEPGADCHAIRAVLERILDEGFSIDHTTLQVDHASRGGLLQIGQRPLGTPDATGR